MTTTALSRSALAGAAEFNPATALGTLGAAALLAGTQGAPPMSRGQATAIGAAENAKYGGKTSDHAFSPYSSASYVQTLPTQAHLDSLTPQPRAGTAPTSHGGVAADHPAAGTMLATRRDAQMLVHAMPAGVSVQEVNCNKPPKPELDATRKAFQGTFQNRFKDGVQTEYVKHIAATKPDELRNLGFSDSQIKDMATNGNTPKVDGQKVEIHHRMPLECGGTNDFDNLTLVRQDVHKPLTESQLAATQGLEYGESRQVELLMMPKGTMYPSEPNALNLPTLNIP